MTVEVRLDKNRFRIFEVGKSRPLRAKKKDGTIGAPSDGGGQPNTPVGQAKIDRQLISPSGAGPVVFGPPKTPSSNRVMTLPDSVEPFDQLFLDGRRQHMARYPNFNPTILNYGGTAADAFSPQRAAAWSGCRCPCSSVFSS